MFRAVRLAVITAALAVSGCAGYPTTDVAQMNFVEAAGVHTHVETWGEGAPVFLIHGASSHIGTWKPTIVPMLKGEFRVAAYDRPGMGYTTDRPAGADTLAMQARVAADVIEQLGLKKPIVVAHSWGGAVALRLALDRPDLVSGLVLIAPVAYEWPGGVDWYNYWSANPLSGWLFNNVIAQPFAGVAVTDGMRGAFAPNTPPQGWLTAAEVSLAARPQSLRANGEDLVAAKREVAAQQARYAEIKIPVAILVGDGDRVVSPTIHAMKLAQTLPNARIDVVAGAGHLPHEIAPQRFRKLFDWVNANK
ncbi:MAG: alpha/beta hydrolase [Alphaproteobacteria bacterium]|nr:MAG: alpha/beta hydrolase [Alphaproteobacteria bacterium]